MKRLTVLASLLIWVIVSRANAQQCSNASLRGVYSFVASGTFAGAAFATAGQTTYEGNGHVYGWIQVSVDGTILPGNGPARWSGTYTVDPSTCMAYKSATLDNNPALGPLAGQTLHFFVTAGADFKELRFIATDAGTAISGTARKQ